MKTAIIHPFLYRYARGIERFTFNLANALAPADVDLHLITWRWPEPVEIDVLDPRVHLHRMPTSRYYAAKAMIPFYTWHLLRQRYDFIWIYFAGYGEAEALNFVRRQRFGIIFHYPYAQVPHRYEEFRRSGLAQRAAQIVSVSRYVADGVQEAFGRESVVIHHGVDTSRFKPDPSVRLRVRHSLGLSSTVPLLVTAAALEERKGIQWVLRAFPQVLQTHAEATYLVLGDGPHRAALEYQAQALGVADHVRFLGTQSDVTPFLQAADISLILSRGEASSLTALESLACGVPTIASSHPPFDELIDSSWGKQIDEANPTEVFDAVDELLRDPVRRLAMGEAGRRHIRANHSWDKIADKYLDLSQNGSSSI